MNEIYSYLDELFPNPKCELNYQKDYELLLSVMLSAQTTDRRVNQVTEILYTKYPSLEALKNAELDDIKEIIKPIGTFNKKAQNIISIVSKLQDIGGIVPNDRTFLESLDGVGRKTANVVLSELFKEPYLAVDTHVARVSKRLGLAKNCDDVLTIEKKLYKKIGKKNTWKMHHQLLLFGRYYCKAIKPECSDCKLKNICKEKRK